MRDYKIFELGDVGLQSGETLHAARLAYQTYGSLNSYGDNVVVLPTFYTGSHYRNEGFFGDGRAIDPAKHFIVSINLFGNGLSTSPDNAAIRDRASNFPSITFYDNVYCQHRLLTEELQVERIALVTGWSMAGCQSFQWGCQYPDMVDAILPFCGSARTSPHNYVFLEGVKAALQADAEFDDGNYSKPPIKGLKAFGRVYAGWAFSQTFYRKALYRQQGFDSVEALLVDWENDHLNWDANNLLSKLRTWQAADISRNDRFNGDFEAALAAIKAKTIIITGSDDLYFPPEDNAYEAMHIPGAVHRVFDSPWGHCCASPGNETGFQKFLDDCIGELIA